MAAVLVQGEYRGAPQARGPALLLSLLLVGAIGWLLVTAFAFRSPTAVADTLKSFIVSAPPPPPPVVRVPPRPRYSQRRSGRAAPPNLKSAATPLVVPLPIVPPIVLPAPVPVAVQPAAGAQATSGNAAVAGPGPGAGGVGDGTGSGGWGKGDGDGGFTPPRWRKGRLRMSDNPYPEEIGGRVEVRYAVEPDGRVGACEIARSSGYPVLDQTTCRLIRERFRYAPSLDPDGDPVRAWIVETHSWEIIQEPPRRQ